MSDIKERVAFTSILASGGIAIAKFFAAFVTGSLGLLSDALHSLLDVGATTMTYFAIRISGIPADDTHHYGHGKVESIAALVETGFLFGVAVYVAIEAMSRITGGGHHVEPSWIAYAVLLGSIGVDIVRTRQLTKVAKETNSEALAADALHFSSDLVSSALVLVGLVFTQLGYPQADSLAAIGVALFIAVAGYKLGRRTIDTLMDAVPAGLADRVRQAADDVPGVAQVQAVRLRPSGHGYNAVLEIGVARTLALQRVNDIRETVTAHVREIVGDSGRITVSTHPVALTDETILERVLHVASAKRRYVHHVMVQRVGEKLSVSLDLELDGRMPISEGHAIADALEVAIMDELGPDVEVETHIEPLDVQGLTGVDIPADRVQAITDALARHAAETKAIDDIHDVRARLTEQGIVVNYHCHVDPALSIAVMHTHVDAIEQAVRREMPDIERAIGHAEPRPVITR